MHAMADGSAIPRLVPLLSHRSTCEKPMEGRRTWRSCMLVALLAVNVALVLILASFYGDKWATPGIHKLVAPQWAEAIQTAELAASK